MAIYGEKLIKNTYDYFYDGEVKIGNKLACSSCHLNGGTKAFAAPYVGLTNVFPTYIGRENKVESLEERINGCFERSMNGRAIPENSKEMRAIITYIKNISINTVNKGRLAGQGFIKMDIPNRAADLKHGQLVFENKCTSCHGKDGQGLPQTAGKGYQYPPLWGKDSYNDGAGMARLLTAARFIKANMPLGATYDAPQLKDDEAYDVAAYINSFDRPQKTNKQLDYPNLSKKPKDSPYPPYADNVSIEQHKLGPFNF
jgi:thiosulfate dehydrogenase